MITEEVETSVASDADVHSEVDWTIGSFREAFLAWRPDGPGVLGKSISDHFGCASIESSLEESVVSILPLSEPLTRFNLTVKPVRSFFFLVRLTLLGSEPETAPPVALDGMSKVSVLACREAFDLGFLTVASAFGQSLTVASAFGQFLTVASAFGQFARTRTSSGMSTLVRSTVHSLVVTKGVVTGFATGADDVEAAETGAKTGIQV